MRTTVEIRDEYRAKLLELAARRGEKGFSSLIDEAIHEYLNRQGDQAKARQRALKLRGMLSPHQAHQLRVETAAIRKSWR